MEIKTTALQLELSSQRSLSLRDITIRSGEKVLIEGPSGCGKTSLLHALGLIRSATKGTISYNGQAAPEPADLFRRKNFGFIFQRLSLIEHLTVEENILLDEVKNLRPEILENLGLLNMKTQTAGILSLGEQQRVAIARALHKQPPLLLADEPTSSLDRPLAEKVGKALTQLSKSTVIAVSHDERIIPFFDRVISWAEILK